MESVDRGSRRRWDWLSPYLMMLIAVGVLLILVVIYQQDKLRDQNERQLEYWARQDQWNADFKDWLDGRKRPKAEFK